ncbi:MAG TPA: hypothetical protein PKH94_00680 [Bacteroidales bacterium]|nr:hypothetical protein [Bacteroidales bacterium]HNS45731.1 hypothetical protein [Bacteroidales bacterium]
MGSSPDPFNTEAADLNADNTIHVLDVTSMVNIIMQVGGIFCPCFPSISYKGRTYTAVQIGSQGWMAENLTMGEKIPA